MQVEDKLNKLIDNTGELIAYIATFEQKYNVKFEDIAHIIVLIKWLLENILKVSKGED